MTDWQDDDYDEDSCEDGYGIDDLDDETSTIRCPNCGTDVYEEAPQCPMCGEYVTFSTSVWDGKPVTWIVLGMAGIIAVILVLSLVH